MKTNISVKKQTLQSSETISKEDYNSFDKISTFKKKQILKNSQPKNIHIKRSTKWTRIEPFGIMQKNKSLPELADIENW